MNQINGQVENQINKSNTLIAMDASEVQNAVLKRLLEEVQNDGSNYVNAYNRTHSRHNRGK